MKKKLLPMLAIMIGLLWGCTARTQEKLGIDPDAAANPLSIEEGYERSSEKMNLSGFTGEITAATLHDNTLWFISEQVLYTANSDGSDVREQVGDLPDGVQYIAFGTDGIIYLGDNLNVHVFTKAWESKSQFALDIDQRFQRLVDLATSPDGDPLALIWSESGYSIRELTSESFGSEVDFNFPANINIAGMSLYNGAVLLQDSNGLSIYSGGEASAVLKWLDIGVVGTHPYVAGITENRDVIYLSRYDGSLYKIQSVPATEKTVLTLAMITEIEWIQPNLETAVAVFNTSNSEYKIEIVKYSSLDQLNVQIIAGDIPDLIETGYPIPFESLAAKGLFEDLNPYFDNDPEVTLVPAIRRILSTGDKLFRVAPGFLAMTLTGSSDYVGSENGWTFEEMKQYLASAPEGSTIFPASWNSESILTFLLYQNMDEFVDWESGRAHFDSLDFKELLEFVYNTVPSEGPTYEEEIRLLLEGGQLITHFAYWAIERFADFDNMFGGKAVYKGFPSSRRYSGVLYPELFTLAMTAACSNKPGAWSFIRTALLIDENRQSIPTVQAKFDLAVKTAMTEPRFDAAPMTQLQYEKFLSFLDGIDTVMSGNLALQTIIQEEIPAYFSGDKSLEEVVNIIQSRAQTYINEQG